MSVRYGGKWSRGTIKMLNTTQIVYTLTKSCTLNLTSDLEKNQQKSQVLPKTKKITLIFARISNWCPVSISFRQSGKLQLEDVKFSQTDREVYKFTLHISRSVPAYTAQTENSTSLHCTNREECSSTETCMWSSRQLRSCFWSSPKKAWSLWVS